MYLSYLHHTMYLIIAAVLLFLFSVYYVKWGRYRLPPGPLGLPFIGIALKVDPTGPHKTFTEWSYKYGDVFMITMYGKQYVVLNGYDSIHKALVTPDFDGRPEVYRWRIIYKFQDGMIFVSSTKKWAFLKKLAMQTLKMYGDNLLTLENISLELIADALGELTTAAQQGQPIDIAALMQDTIAGIITSLLYGKQANPNTVREFLANQQAAIERTPTGFALDCVPALRYFPLWKTYRGALEVQRKMEKIYNEEIQDTRDRYEPGNPKCFFHGIFEYQRNNNGKPETEFDVTEGDLYALNADMIQAGSVTTSVTMNSLMAVLVNHPHIQDKMAAEIKHVIGEQQPRLEDRTKMNYCEAVILEVLRYQTMLPLNALHLTTTDTTMNGYDIPKGTNVFFNLWKINHDSAFWDNPWEFQPERFLDENGDLVPVDHPNRKRMLVFGTGRRVCIGQTLARNRMFLIITSMIQHFQFLPESDTKRPKHDPRDYINAFNIFPYPYKVIVKFRN